MKTREEAKLYFQAQIGDAPKDSPIEYTPSTPNKQANHYGRVEVEELLDFIYGTDEAVKWAQQMNRKHEESAARLRQMLKEQDDRLTDEEKLRAIQMEGYRAVLHAMGRKLGD